MGKWAGVAAFAVLLGAVVPSHASGADGYHAAFFAESAFLTLSPGQTGQFSAGFANTGSLPWIVGAGQASLHTAAPLDNTNDSAAGWSSSWPAPNVYAVQGVSEVAPGQIAFFTYVVRAPVGASGPHTFYGQLVIDGVGPLEDFGYYQVATVQAAGSGFPGGVAIATGPVEPSKVRYSGTVTDALTGAPLSGACVYAGPLAGCPTPNLNTDASGYWAIDFPSGSAWDLDFEYPAYNPYRVPSAPLTTAVSLVSKASGYTTGVLTGTGPVPPSQTRYSGTVTESVSGLPVPGVCVYAGPAAGCPSVALASDASGRWALDLPSGSQWVFNFERPAYSTQSAAASGSIVNVTLSRRGAGSQPTAAPSFVPPPTPVPTPIPTTAPASTTSPTPTAAPTNPPTPAPTPTPTATPDTTQPTILTATWISATQFSVTYSKAMKGGSSISNSAGNTGNYSVNNTGSGSFCLTGGTGSITGNAGLTVFTITCTGANGVWGSAGTNTLTVSNVADNSTSANVITPNPRSQAF